MTDTVIEIVESTKEEKCAICMEEMDINQTRLACSHGYHQECIARWLEQKSTCPICRHEVAIEPNLRTQGDSPPLSTRQHCGFCVGMLVLNVSLYLLYLYFFNHI